MKKERNRKIGKVMRKEKNEEGRDRQIGDKNKMKQGHR
jgi:hypothetical protein